MSDKDKKSDENDSLQSSETDLARGEDARAFGAGGQKVLRPFEPGHSDARDREPGRDPTVPRFEDSGDGRR